MQLTPYTWIAILKDRFDFEGPKYKPMHGVRWQSEARTPTPLWLNRQNLEVRKPCTLSSFFPCLKAGTGTHEAVVTATCFMPMTHAGMAGGKYRPNTCDVKLVKCHDDNSAINTPANRRPDADRMPVEQSGKSTIRQIADYDESMAKPL